jgi:chromosome segregation ATPase
VRHQRTGQDELRRSREEAAEHLRAARAEADDLRGQARRHLDDAREEVARLHKRREEITRELGDLSGVIAALAVPGEETTGREQLSQQADRPDEQTEQTEEEDVTT